MREAQETNVPGGAIRTRRKLVMPRTPTQGAYIEAIRKNELVFGIGPAGTGKTYLAVACAAEALMNGEVDRIVLSRPAVEAGERLGFLPGDMKEEVDPYLRPLYDALYDMMPASLVAKGIAENQIEIAPLAFMRGRTLSSAFIILDEAQNTTPQQMKMFLTRLGEGSRMVQRDVAHRQHGIEVRAIREPSRPCGTVQHERHVAPLVGNDRRADRRLGRNALPDRIRELAGSLVRSGAAHRSQGAQRQESAPRDASHAVQHGVERMGLGFWLLHSAGPACGCLDRTAFRTDCTLYDGIHEGM